LHSGALPISGGIVKMIFGSKSTNFKSELKRGVKSKAKPESDITISFEAYKVVEPIVLSNGSKVDYFDRGTGKYKPAIIQKMSDGKSGKLLYLYLESEPEGQNKREVYYPNKKMVAPCGDHIRGRDCKGSRNEINTYEPIKIRFVTKNYKGPGDYLADTGLVFGQTGKAFGWSRDMTSRIRNKGLKGNKPDVSTENDFTQTLVEFPPSPKSKFCTKPNPDVICENITWSVKAGNGKFNIKLYVQDVESNTRLDLKVNDQYFAQEKTVTKGKLEVFEGVVESDSGYLTVSSECVNNCEFAMSKLNMFEFYPYDENMVNKKVEPLAEMEVCGGSIVGGKCDSGPDVTHCLFQGTDVESAKFCIGELILMEIPTSYKCEDQRKKLKCVKRKYKDNTECLKYCPRQCRKAYCS